MAFFEPLFDSQTSILGTLGGHFGTLWLHFGSLGLPRGGQRGPPGVKGGFWVDFGCPWDPLGWSFWLFVFLFVCVFGVKSGGWVADLFLSSFEVEK